MTFLITCPSSSDDGFARMMLTQEPKRPSSEAFFAALLGGHSISVFVEKYFERHPVHIQRAPEHAAAFRQIFSREKLLTILTRNAPIPLESNLTAVRYVNKSREDRVFASPTANKRELEQAFKDKFTVQFYQPQRFGDELHRINAMLENLFGSLAGASAYLTPANTQGLAPHWDDVDVFVLQTEGSKSWNLWPNATYELPGDVLYMPRGTIHEAIAQDEFSTHVTISMYQKYNMKLLLNRIVPRLLESAFSCDIRYRRGLPLRMCEKLGSYAALQQIGSEGTRVGLVNSISDGKAITGGGLVSSGSDSGSSDSRNSSSSSSKSGTNYGNYNSICSSSSSSNSSNSSNNNSGSSVKQWREDFCRHMKDLLALLPDMLTTELLDETADEITGDFVMHRLPPPYDINDPSSSPRASPSPSASASSRLNMDSLVIMGDPHEMFVMVKEYSGVRVLAMAHCRSNRREFHMGHPPMSSSFDDEGDDYEEEDEEDEDEDEDEDDEGEDDDDGEEDGDDDEDGFNWSLHLPVRLAPLLITLQKIRNGQETPPAPITATSTTTITTTTATTTTATSAASGAVSIRQLHQMVASQRIFDDEVLTTVQQLALHGFLHVVPSPCRPSATGSPSAVRPSPKSNKKDGTSTEATVPVVGIRKPLGVGGKSSISSKAMAVRVNGAEKGGQIGDGKQLSNTMSGKHARPLRNDEHIHAIAGSSSVAGSSRLSMHQPNRGQGSFVRDKKNNKRKKLRKG